jgi:hypothetical protein
MGNSEGSGGGSSGGSDGGNYSENSGSMVVACNTSTHIEFGGQNGFVYETQKNDCGNSECKDSGTYKG